jgi:hypothetical protein
MESTLTNGATERPAPREEAAVGESLESLTRHIRGCWDQDTSSLPREWSEDNTARGHCAVSALVVQDTFGGRLLRCLAGGESHYYNELPNGETVDITRDQFPPHMAFSPPVERQRSYVLDFPDTVRRYEVLKARLSE